MIEKIKTTIWGRKFTLPVIYDCYEGEIITSEQKNAMKQFSEHLDLIEASKEEVEKFCKKEVMSDNENNKKDNIFSYIKPEALFIKHEGPSPRIALMCKYRYDPEHGLAVVFSSKGDALVGKQDIIL